MYIGTIIDQHAVQPLSESLEKELLLDMSSALDVRETAVRWNLAESLNHTDPFAHGGYKLASRVLRNDRQLIGALAGELFATGTMNLTAVEVLV